jgi:hypothetical protein
VSHDALFNPTHYCYPSECCEFSQLLSGEKKKAVVQRRKVAAAKQEKVQRFGWEASY